MISIKGFLMLGLLTAVCMAPVSAQPATDTLDRTVLPIAEPQVSTDHRESTPARPRRRRGSR